MVSGEALKKLQEQVMAWPITQRFVVQQLIEDYRMDREDLRAYKDTGLTPKETKRMSNILMDVGIDYNCSWEYVKNWLLDDRLRELAEADRDGRVVVLPCKVGDTVYLLFAGNPNNPVISTLKINTVAEAVKLIGKMGMHKYIGTFRTREEAEKALEAIQNE